MSATPPINSLATASISPPRALARLQFHAGFTLDDAATLVDYYADLGVSHLYASPLLTARPGSMHGYDVIDCHHINPELGGEPALRRLVAGLRERGMGLVLDIVPNHMFAGSGNAWWMDVLRHGRASRHAGYFDIDWLSPDPLVRGHLLLPILGKGYAETLRDGDIQLTFDTAADEFTLRVYDTPLPLSPPSQELLKNRGGARATLGDYDPADEQGRQRLDALIELQHYRLVLWKLASDIVNYRRFFDINELAGLRIERTRVFEDSHALIFRLYAEGLIDGVRVDHVDGLADPHRYCRQLRHRLRQLQRDRPSDAARGPAYIVVEKILAEGERLRPEWRVDGTTGYEFMEQVSAWLHNRAGEAPLTELWRAISGDPDTFADYARAARRQILVDSFEAELDRTARALFAAARSELATRDVSLAAIRRVLIQLLIYFPVYRTYAGGMGRDEIDEAVFQRAYAQARRQVRMEDRELLADVSAWLGGQPPRALPPGPVRKARERAMRIFQQATSPMAAKAVEDTACYRYGRLLSRNEVGADPQQLALDSETFHAECAQRARQFPHTVLATATHDHKRGEDARARLAVLSDVTPAWAETVNRWRTEHAALRAQVDGQTAPSPPDEYMLYQAIVGAWPLELTATDTAGLKAFSERIAQWQRKALREAKRRSRWTLPNEPYEDACETFLTALLQPGQGPARSLHDFVQRIAAAGAANSLAQTVLKLTSPGIPDIYQGTEFWDFSLVDPDNRRPVDFDARRSALSTQASADELLGHWRDGHLKQHVIHQLLDLRQRHARLFANGSYRPLHLQTSNDDPTAPQLFGFERTIERERTRDRVGQRDPTERSGRTGRTEHVDHDRLIVLVLRHTGSRLLDADTPQLSQTELSQLPSLHAEQLQPSIYRDILSGRQAGIGNVEPGASAGFWLQTIPVAVLEPVAE